jgi:hypothetical protein
MGMKNGVRADVPDWIAGAVLVPKSLEMSLETADRSEALAKKKKAISVNWSTVQQKEGQMALLELCRSLQRAVTSRPRHTSTYDSIPDRFLRLHRSSLAGCFGDGVFASAQA